MSILILIRHTKNITLNKYMHFGPETSSFFLL